MKNLPEALRAFLSDYALYLIAGHSEPDGDCIASALALRSFLQRRGKEAVLLSAGPFNRTETREYAASFRDTLPENMPEQTAVVIVDCSDAGRTGRIAAQIAGYPTAVIDHHATNSCAGEADFVDGSIPASALLVQHIIEEMSGGVTKQEAETLLFGVCTDTGFFRHLDNKSAETFAAVSRLVAAGADPKKTYAKIKNGKSFSSRLLIAAILSRMQQYYDGRLIVSFQTLAETEKYGNEARDSDSLYQMIQAIAGVEAIVVVKQETAETCSVGFRSLDKIDVSAVASAFGGGGHKQASGLNIAGRAEELIPQFVKAFVPQFS